MEEKRKVLFSHFKLKGVHLAKGCCEILYIGLQVALSNAILSQFNLQTIFPFSKILESLRFTKYFVTTMKHIFRGLRKSHNLKRDKKYETWDKFYGAKERLRREIKCIV